MSLPVPRHVAIIMDGNGRWAERRGLPRSAGHRAGVEAVTRTLEAARDAGVEMMTLYAFSTENWKRPAAEVAALMSLLVEFLAVKLPELQRDNVRLRTVGRTAGLPDAARKALLGAVSATADNAAFTLNLALNYGGRAEIADAAARLAADAAAGKILPDKIDEAAFARYLYAPDLPDPDLLIRTSGEMRLSNFLLWELAYTEIYVTDCLWPDFSREELAKALDAYAHRDRRFGNHA